MIVPRRSTLSFGRIVQRIGRLCPARHRELVRGMAAEVDSIADPAERRRFALGAIAAIARLVLMGKSVRYDRSYFRMVGLALLPALGVSITTEVVGGMAGGSESVVHRVSQIVLFPTFWAACHYIRARRTPPTA
jgi:hypothetical protein